MPTKVSRTALNAEGTGIVIIEIVVDEEGYTITTQLEEAVAKVVKYSLDEGKTIYELMHMLQPGTKPKA